MKRIVLVLSAMVLLSGVAQAATWQYPNEISVAEVYNTLFGTTYDTTTQEGLATLLADHPYAMTDVWNTSLLKAIEVSVFDTGSSAPLGVLYGDGYTTYASLFNPGSWTSPSRGYLPSGGGVIDLVALMGEGADFKFVVGNTVLDSSNSIALLGIDGSLFIGYNEGGFSGDQDFNEPLIHSVANTPLPAAVWLLGTGLLGLISLRRNFMN